MCSGGFTIYPGLTVVAAHPKQIAKMINSIPYVMPDLFIVTIASVMMGYILWIFGFTGSERFYYGRPISGTIYFCTFGLLGIGWFLDLFLIPSMAREADLRFKRGQDKL